MSGADWVGVAALICATLAIALTATTVLRVRADKRQDTDDPQR